MILPRNCIRPAASFSEEKKKEKKESQGGGVGMWEGGLGGFAEK